MLPSQAAWARTLSGDTSEGEAPALLAMKLSPIDPLRYAMLATCALSHVIKGNYDEAAMAGERAAQSPDAHKHIEAIAAILPLCVDRRARDDRAGAGGYVEIVKPVE
ncbi:MAG: hypothetical protein AB7U35_12040 [Sphingobium sp.]